MSLREKLRRKPKKASITDTDVREIEKKKSRRPYIIVSSLSVVLFLGLAVYLCWFQVTQSRALLNNKYNKRSEKLAEKITRGSILASDGTVLAETQTDGSNETRDYPYGSLFAHTVGYLDNGSSGLEASENDILLTSHANLVEQMARDIQDRKKQGDNLVTTFDVNLQKTASDSLGDHRGAVLVMDADTGKILVDVSKPSFDPNKVKENWDTLTGSDESDSGVLVNRALQGLYPPGSTFKLVTSLAYYRKYGTFDQFRYTCDGTYTNSSASDFTIHCASNKAHGSENFEDALANSCNCAFAYMASELLSVRELRDAAEDLGFNSKVSLELPTVKSRFTLQSDSGVQLVMQTGIGQGNTQATPLQMCQIVQAIANDGVMMKPQLLDHVESSDGKTVKTYDSSRLGQVMSADETEHLTDAMKQVVQRGTASSLSSLPYDIAGKTGTAQYSDEDSEKAHSWFVGFSNTGQNDIAVCVLVEDGGNGNYPAYNVAGDVFDAYFKENAQ